MAAISRLGQVEYSETLLDLINAVIAEVDFGAGNLTDYPTQSDEMRCFQRTIGDKMRAGRKRAGNNGAY